MTSFIGISEKFPKLISCPVKSLNSSLYKIENSKKKALGSPRAGRCDDVTWLGSMLFNQQPYILRTILAICVHNDHSIGFGLGGLRQPDRDRALMPQIAFQPDEGDRPDLPELETGGKIIGNRLRRAVVDGHDPEVTNSVGRPWRRYPG